MTDPRERFSSRVEDYVRYRPDYPDALLAELLTLAGPAADIAVADVGSGTGIFTRKLLEHGFRVYGVEPNASMREAAREYLAGFDRFTSIDGSAEDCGLADGSVELITAAQAFHWFNNERTRIEFRRILKPRGKLALIWNRRQLDQPFQQAYDALLRKHAPEYGRVNHMSLEDAEIAGFFAPGKMQVSHFGNSQQLDFDGLVGRLKSSSYCPDVNSARYEALIDALRTLLDEFEAGNSVDFDYDTRLYCGELGE